MSKLLAEGLNEFAANGGTIVLAKKSDAEKIESCVLDLKAKGYDMDTAFAICTASVKDKNKKASEEQVDGIKLNSNMNTVDSLVKVLVRKGINEVDALFFSNKIFKNVESEKHASLIKRFEETEAVKSYMGKTMEEEGTNHTHEYALMILNWGEQLVGITINTSTGNEHPHLIDIPLDYKIRKIMAWTNMSDVDPESESGSDFHKHSFEADVESIRRQIPSIYIRGYAFSEKTQKPLPDGYIDIGKLADHSYGFSNQREAEALLAQAVQFSEKPAWMTCELEEYQANVFNSVFKHYPESRIFDDSRVAELELNSPKVLARDLDPKAKVRNRGDVVVPANQAKDKKDHFPINNENQARNALARVNQYKKAPSWWSGSLESLKTKIKQAVKKKYPKINVTGLAEDKEEKKKKKKVGPGGHVPDGTGPHGRGNGPGGGKADGSGMLSEFFTIRFKDSGSAFFINSAATNLQEAKEDAFVYSSQCPNLRVDILVFKDTAKESCEFSEVGGYCFYNLKEKGTILVGSDQPIKLSDRDSKGRTVIEILRTGNYKHPQYGDFTITDRTLNDIINNFNKRVLDRDVSFDFNHESDLPAAAWAQELSTTRRGFATGQQTVLLAHVDWTKRGEEAVKNGDYRYFSSEFVDNFINKETSEEYGTTLKGGGLTNRPWIPGLRPIELSEQREKMAFIINK